MAAILLSSNAPGAGASSPLRNQPQSSSSTSPPAKSFRMFRSSLGETIRTATRSKAKNKDLPIVANETGIVTGLARATSRIKKDDSSKDKERLTISKDKGKEKESVSRPSVDASSTPPTTEDSRSTATGLMRLTGRTGFRKKSIEDVSPPASSSSPKAAQPPPRTKGRTSSGGWTSFMTPSLSAGSMSSPAIHLASDPADQDTPATNMSPSTSIGALISPVRRRTTLTSKESVSSPRKNSSSGTRQPPEPMTFSLSSSSRRLPPSPSTPVLGHYPEASISADHTARPQAGVAPTHTPTVVRRYERSPSPGSGSASGSGSRSSSPPTARRPGVVANPPSTVKRRPTIEQRGKHPTYGSISSPLPLGASPPAAPAHYRRSSRERSGPPQAPSSASTTALYQRRNSSSTSFTNSQPVASPSAGSRAISPIYKGHARNASATSLTGVKPMSIQRETMRAAASFVVREMVKPPPAAIRSTPTSPYGGLAGAPAGVKVDPWEEVEIRLQPLARVERLWARSGATNGTFGNGSTATVNVTSSATISSGGEDRERRVFCEALRDGYVLAQLMNRLNPTSPLPIPRVDPREDGFTKTSNIVKFRDAAKTFITKSGSDAGDILKEMFGKDDLADGSVDGAYRVSRVIALLATLKGDPDTQRWITKERGSDETSGRASRESIREPPKRSGTISRNLYNSGDPMAASTPNLNGRTSISPTKKRWSPPSPNGSYVSPEPSIDSRSTSLIDRRSSVDKRKLGPAPISIPSTPPITRPSERRSSGGQYLLNPPPPNSPPNPPARSALRTAPSLTFASNRASVASSAQSAGTDNTQLFENGNRASNSWGREAADEAIIALGLADALDGASSGPSIPAGPKRRSFDPKPSPTSGLGIALQQSYPPVASAELFSEGTVTGRRRERRSSEIAIDLTTVLEATDAEGSIKPKSPTRRTSDNRGRATPESPGGLNIRKGRWPEDLAGLFPGSSSAAPPRTPTLRRTSTETSAKAALLQELGASLEDNDATPKAKSPHTSTQPITIITSASRDTTPREERDEFIDPVQPFRRPTHRAGSLSVDVLLPRPAGQRRISIERRVSAERRERLLGHDRDSSSGSGESPGPETLLRRPLRRASTRDGSASRNGMYLGRSTSGDGEEQGSGSSLLPVASSVPAVSHIRVPFPRSTSGEQSSPAGETTPNGSSRPSNSTIIREGLLPVQRDGDYPSTTRPSLNRFRYQSEFEAPRMFRRGSSGLGVDRLGSPGLEDGPGTVLRGRSRMESLQNAGGMSSSTNLTRASSQASGLGSNMRRTLIVKEEGKAPMHYQLGNCIGKGQFGAVYRALNLGTGQMVAVKRIGLEGLPESEVTQLMKEVELLKKLQHPSIVSYEGMVRDEDSLDIVLEYVENGSLGQTLKAFGKFNEKLVATYVTKILEGLHYLHEQQVVHCDLKAANILSTKNGNIKLSDFGVSLALNAVESAKEQDNVAGTPNWMAPEVIELKGASTASDIWSLGCTVVELLTGRPPYSDVGNTLSVMFRIVEDHTPPIPDGCSEPLQDFLSLCFKKNPTERPTAEVLFEHPWLKRTWGLNEELRPQDSVPFLRRVSTDLHKSDLARQLSILNLAEGVRPDAAQSSSKPELSPAEEPEFIMKPHSFVKTTFSKHVNCRVCHLHVKKSAVLCEECSLICHATCVKDAPPHCDIRAQLLFYSQYSMANGGGSNGSPFTSTPSALPAPSTPGSADPPLSSSPSHVGRLFAWKRNSKSALSEVSSAGTPANGSANGGIDETNHRKSGGGGAFLFRRSEDRSRTRRDSIQDSHHSSSMRSAVTAGSQSLTRQQSLRQHELAAQYNRLISSTSPDGAGRSNTTPPPHPVPAPPSSPPALATSPPADATRKRRTRRDSVSQSKSDCVIQ